ncbi:DUF3237 domain-containing protein [Mastigocoleus testarum]|uniref:Uncharacterized protein n=1 Tax=Mastigocoleus testarum BC008 TaxID=371196 RepID=A0A0V7ZNB6_9CYAN|nr:DUF3237 domain-containing protein [Mastigocoleus testarum]KST65711.1 hypothetical protein BC008_22300 [Mastigocoleus testarum BC008]
MELVHEFTYTVYAKEGLPIGKGPYGERQCFEFREGVVQGEHLNGKVVGPGADWILMGEDSWFRMDCRTQIQTNDGAYIYVIYLGLVEANETFRLAVKEKKETKFDNQYIRAYFTLETGDPRYNWVNQALFIGEARLVKNGPGMEHKVYRLA